MSAKFYIYRNLRTGGFSVRHKGVVVDRLSGILAHNVHFTVHDSARQRVLQTKQKNVHAFVVCEHYTRCDSSVNADLEEIKYNPYLYSDFTLNNKPLKGQRFPEILLQYGKVFVDKKYI